jgi:LmbE family N-acetylglucosaminyl deacetylase
MGPEPPVARTGWLRLLIAGAPWAAADAGVGAASPTALMTLERGARLLILADASRAALLREQAPDATVLTDLALLDGEAQFDGAIIDGLLEHERWDRWVLQRVHRVLRTDAPIVVVVPPLMSLASATDIPFLAYSALQVLRSLLRRLKPGFDLPGRAYRRYHLPFLVNKLESAGFAAVKPGPGWRGSEGVASEAWFAQRAAVSARKASGVAGVPDGTRPDGNAAAVRYAELFAANRAARDAWLSAFPELGARTPRAMDLSQYRGARVLVLSPHPDDELIGCGGTLCRLLAAGAEVSILQATDGSRLESLCDLPRARRKTVRLREAGRVASALGATLVAWGEEDQRLRCCEATIDRLARLLEEWRPSLVFTPFLADRHVDHRTLSRILGRALSVARTEPEVFQYEVWSVVPADVYCNTTDEEKTVERLLLHYERALQVENFVAFCHSRNLARGLGLLGRPAYAEAFLSTTSAEYRRLVERTSD